MLPSEKLYYAIDDGFFADGNSVTASGGPQFEKSVMLIDSIADDKCSTIVCGEHGCQFVCENERDFEAHHEFRHKFCCVQCKRPFPTNFLLEIHIAETHDPFFGVKSERTDSYRCLVTVCGQMFKTPETRKHHLIHYHKFPSDFKFDPTFRKKPSTNSDDSRMDVDQLSPVDSPQSKTDKKINANRVSFGANAQKGFQDKRRGKDGHKRTTGSAGEKAISTGTTDERSELAEALPDDGI